MAAGGSAGTLYVTVAAKTDKLVRGMTTARNVTKTATMQMKSFAVMAAGGLGLTSLAATLHKTVKSYNDLNSAMTRSLAIMGDVSDEMKGNMRSAALEVSRTTQFSASEAAKAYFYLASAGMNAEQSLAAMPQVAKFAQAGNFDLALATDLATDAQSAMGLSVKETQKNLTNLTRVTDVLVKSNTLANATTQQFSEALTSGAGVAGRMASQEIEDVVAVLATFADQGIKGAEAGTAYGIVMRDLQTKALTNESAFKRAGVAVFDHSGKVRVAVDIIQDLERALKGMSDEQKKSTLMMLGFSDKSVKYVQTLLGTTDKIRDYTTGLKDANGTVQEIADKSLTRLEESLNRVRNAFERLGETSAPVIDTFSNFIDGLTKLGGGKTSEQEMQDKWKSLAEYARQQQAANDPQSLQRFRNILPSSGFSPALKNESLQRAILSEQSKLGLSFIPATAAGSGFPDAVAKAVEKIDSLLEIANEKNKPQPGTIATAFKNARGSVADALGRGRDSLLGQAKFAAIKLGELADKANSTGIKFSLFEAPLNRARIEAERWKEAKLEEALAAKEAEEKSRHNLAMGAKSFLEFTRSGSVESYRQRAAIARQNNPMLEIGKKQLKAGERTAVAVEQIAKNGVALMPANLKGG